MNFNEKVWKQLSRIPKGKVSTYSDIAVLAGSPGGARAVGNACNKNENAPIVPCHRVVKSDGSLGGYALGLKKKIELLKNEGIKVQNNKIKNFENVKWNR